MYWRTRKTHTAVDVKARTGFIAQNWNNRQVLCKRGNERWVSIKSWQFLDQMDYRPQKEDSTPRK
jgi:hypothetical protein